MVATVVLGLDFGGSKMAAAAADSAGRRLGSVVSAVDPDLDAEETFARGVRAAQHLLADVAEGLPLAVVGACTFGIPHDDRVALAPNITGWEDLAFGSELRRAFPRAEVRITTDVKAAAWAEVEDGALTGSDPGLYVNLGTGFAAAIVVGGTVVTGRHDASGEIGYGLRQLDTIGDAARVEQVVSGKALEAAAMKLLGRPDVGALFALADTSHAAARACEQFTRELCYHLVNLTIAIDPQRVVIGGGLVRSWDRLRSPLAAAFATGVPFPPELVMAAHPYDAPLIGALSLARAALPDLSVDPDVLEGAPS